MLPTHAENPNSPPNFLGRYARARREELGLTLLVLSDRIRNTEENPNSGLKKKGRRPKEEEGDLRVSASFFARLERGEVDPIPELVIESLSKVLCVSKSRLVLLARLDRIGDAPDI